MINKNLLVNHPIYMYEYTAPLSYSIYITIYYIAGGVGMVRAK